MEGTDPSPTRVPCVGAIVRDERGRVLLVRRGTEPQRGRWSVPGGRIEPGESGREAVVREVEEETHLRVIPTGVAGVVEREGPGGVVFVIEDWFARLEPGADPHRLLAGDDAAEAAWYFPDVVAGLDCVDGLVEALRDWHVLPR